MFYSPLRYPGGKSSLSKFMRDLIEESELDKPSYFELYAGGAGAGLELLCENYFSEIILNDADYHIYAFWYSVLNFNDEFIELINNCKIDIPTWKQQKEIYLDPKNYSIFEVGFSTFYLNRCNRSGILHKAGPIGGMKQKGDYKIDVRFTRSTLVSRVEKIKKYKGKINIHCEETIDLLNNIFAGEELDNAIIYLDPPYYDQGENLYLSYYKHEDHQNLANILLANRDQNWFLTYDNKPEILEMYDGLRVAEYSTRYTLQDKKNAKEVLIFSDSLNIPDTFRIYQRESELIML